MKSAIYALLCFIFIILSRSQELTEVGADKQQCKKNFPGHCETSERCENTYKRLNKKVFDCHCQPFGRRRLCTCKC
uniref:S-locus pollen protein n=1 Tax=Brassica campestris TaxID=3711 RepID=Q9MB55_BRACM|nr:S-locus pollen protein [Brassica rapa]